MKAEELIEISRDRFGDAEVEGEWNGDNVFLGGGYYDIEELETILKVAKDCAANLPPIDEFPEEDRDGTVVQSWSEFRWGELPFDHEWGK